MSTFYFPFGQPLTKVQQSDKTPKTTFILGVYASAVYAKWVKKEGIDEVKALAVASEPEIFWTGSNVAQIIAAIEIPEELGKLTVPTNANYNGPSGRALDNLYLKPLGLDRNSVWLCDLVPESRKNEGQRKAIRREYKEEISKYNLSPATVPDYDKRELNLESRREEIIAELEASQATTIILLGDLPITWSSPYHEKKFTKLSQFGETNETYGKEYKLNINNKEYTAIALCHTKQADGVAMSNEKWRLLHENWVKEKNAHREVKK